MKVNKKLLAPLITIGVFGAVAVGSTYALFTSNSESKVAVSSGKVNLEAEYDDSSLKVYSASTTQTLIDGDAVAGTEEINASSSDWEGSGQEAYKATYYYEKQAEVYSGSDGDGVFFKTHGHAAINSDGNQVALDKMAPGDRVLFNVDVKNSSNIDIKYRLRFALNDDSSLYDAEHTLADAQLFASALKYSWGDSSYSKWHEWSAESVVRTKTLWFDFELPILEGNTYQDKLAYFKFTVEAVQANAYTEDPVEPMETDKKVAQPGQAVDLETNSAAVHVPADAVAADTELHLEVEPNVNGGYTFDIPVAGTAASYDLTVVDADGNNVSDIVDPETIFDCKLYLGAVELHKFYHYGEEITMVASKADISLTQAFYDNDPESAEFGWLFFKTKSFSPFCATYEYAGGFGNEAYPYLVENVAQLKRTSSTNAKYMKIRTTYYKLVEDIIVKSTDVYISGTTEYVIANGIKCDYDGNGHMITIKCDDSKSIYPYLFYQTQYIKVHDMDITINDQALILNAYQDTEFENVDTYGYLNVSNNSSVYIIYCQYGATFKSCDSYVDIRGHGSSGSYNAIYVGYTFDDLITFIDCHNKGSIICGKAVMFVGNIHNSYSLSIDIQNCSNDGIIQWCDTANSQGQYGFYNQICAGSGQCLGSVTVDGVAYTTSETIKAIDIPTTGSGKNVWGPQDSKLAIEKSASDTLVVTEAQNEDAELYEVIINTYAGIDDGGSRQIAISLKFNKTEFVEGKFDTGLKALNFVDQYWVAAHPEAVQGTLAGQTIYTLDGVSYYFVNIQGGNFGPGGVAAYTSIAVSCYDANNVPLATASLIPA